MYCNFYEINTGLVNKSLNVLHFIYEKAMTGINKVHYKI